MDNSALGLLLVGNRPSAIVVEKPPPTTEIVPFKLPTGELSANLGSMASPNSPKDKFFVNVINPYLAEVKRHPQTLWVEDGVLYKEDLKGPVKEGSTKARMEEVEQEVFKYKLMIERGVEANFDIIAELKKQHEKEMKEV
ncbi:40s ribosomal protein s5-1 [Hordeum vulgare]|nr:40s ribosomal protein s5-1 [Hordeum vulgare]